MIGIGQVVLRDAERNGYLKKIRVCINIIIIVTIITIQTLSGSNKISNVFLILSLYTYIVATIRSARNEMNIERFIIQLNRCPQQTKRV